MKRTRMKPVNPVRKARRDAVAFGRQAELCRQLPCCVCGAPPPSDPDHVRTRGAGGKDQDTAPLCRGCHDKRHAGGHFGPFRGQHIARLTFEPERYGWNPPMVKLADTARAFFEHVAQGLRATFALRDDGWQDCQGFCSSTAGGGFMGPVCMTCMCCRACAVCLEFPGGRCPECKL